MNRAINNIDKNFHESFSAKGFRYLNVDGGAATTTTGAILDASNATTPASRCPPGYEWAAGRCNKQVAMPNSGGLPAPTPVPVPTPRPAPRPGPGGTPLPLPAPVPPFPTPTPTPVPTPTPTPVPVPVPTPVPTPMPVPVPVPTPTPGPAPAPLPPSSQVVPGPIYPGAGGYGGGAGAGGYEEPVAMTEELAIAMPAEEINWPAIVIAGAFIGLTYWYMGQDKSAA